MDIRLLILDTEVRPVPSKGFLATRPGKLELRTVTVFVEGARDAHFVCGLRELENEVAQCVKQALRGHPSPVSRPPSAAAAPPPPTAPSVSEDRIVQLRAMKYEEYLRTPEWQRTRQQAIERARFRCQVCNAAAGLEVHHRNYEDLGAERPWDLTVLCDGCHELFHENRRLVRP